MNERFLIASPYKIEELGESEERQEIYEFIEAERFDCLGTLGEALVDGKWHTVWEFRSAKEAERFMREWGGIHFDERQATEWRDQSVQCHGAI